jgi:uncharacterized protein YeaO (DUF488 family)
MTLLEGYIAQWKNYPKDEIKVRVARPSMLSPSKDLLKDYKEGLIDWGSYQVRFTKQIRENPMAMIALRHYAVISKTQDIRLICYEKNPPCHRFILMDMINSIKSQQLRNKSK